jgi:hypothetical protein
MSYKHSLAYIPNLVKIYETADQMFEENNMIEFKNNQIDIANKHNAIRIEYKLHESKAYIIATVEFPSFEDYSNSIVDSAVQYNNSNQHVIICEINTHLF